MTAKPQQRSVGEELTLERQLTEAKRQIAAREATIKDQARQLEAQDEQAWELVRKFTKLIEERA
jgi:CII-binding regulator of phage lambda lysogenization HflD